MLINLDIQDNKIDFSGIIPNGFQGTEILFSLVLNSKQNMITSIENQSFYLNDGLGTEIK